MNNEHSLQSALALLIRFPHRNRGANFKKFIKDFGLDPTFEKTALRLAEDNGVEKFGRNMANVRWGSLLKHLRHSKPFISESVLHQLWIQEFEPIAAKTRGVDLALAFLDFLLEHPKSNEALVQTSPPFMRDLLEYDRAESRFWFGKANEHVVLSPKSRLRHKRFLILNLEYDVPEFLRLKKKDTAVAEPAKRSVGVLLVGAAIGFRVQAYEIDSAISEYLIDQLSTEPNQALPKFFLDLEALGLVYP